ncbi:hypothetical protein [Actinokineospora globicatena]|uniref:hypothetical protein n=1 Tax=Actinokineospora globicatena TaxID=103729 RepID=UPI0020A4E2F9|nr:hypothetical protein [Actinokineospora globicatena]MCP2303974.1 hypothetical protein [Actinokineospora globicatena]GLW78864.1 hypothetical protein Aglo01_33460 [Actinokineospora globicatena]GLW86723.1 hypothetical protein Aglo02_43620 [Actinokineospora globicatena]
MRKWMTAVLAVVLVTGVASPAAAEARPGRDRLTGTWVLLSGDSALVERRGGIGLGSRRDATRWRLVYTGVSEGGPAYLIQRGDGRGWVLPQAVPGAPVRVAPFLATIGDARTQRWTIHTNRTKNDATGTKNDAIDVSINSALNGWPVIVTGDYDPRVVVVPETFAPVTYRAVKVGN